MSGTVVDRDQEIRRLYRDGNGYRRIARELGVSESTVRRVVVPGYAEASAATSRAAKRRRTGTCERCGGVTRYAGGRRGPDVSRICADCSIRIQHEDRIWTRATVIDAIRRFATAHGRPPTAGEWINADPSNGYPPRSGVYGSRRHHPFAKWADAIEAAGFPRPTPARRTASESRDRDPEAASPTEGMRP